MNNDNYPFNTQPSHHFSQSSFPNPIPDLLGDTCKIPLSGAFGCKLPFLSGIWSANSTAIGRGQRNGIHSWIAGGTRKICEVQDLYFRLTRLYQSATLVPHFSL